MSRRTKIIITIGVILLIVALAALVYYLFFKKPAQPEAPGEFPAPTEEATTTAETPTVIPEGKPGVFEPILRQLSKEPAAGAVIGNRSGEPVVRYMERATGNVYEIGAAAGGKKRLTNTTIPKVYEALWSKSGGALIARYVRDGSETIESFSAKINPAGGAGGEGELSGTFLPRGIADAATSPDGTSLFYLQEENGGAIGIKSDLSGNGKIKLWTSPLKEWNVFWPAQGRILLLSRPSALAEGMLLSLDPGKGSVSLLLRGIPGLTALGSPARGDLLYSQSSDSGIALFLVRATPSKAEQLDVTTLPEKCVWTKNGDRIYCGVPKTVPSGSYPDAWYQGVVSFADAVWSISPSGASERIIDLGEKRGSPLDLANPQVSADEKFLIFTDKESGTLWSLQMKE